MLRRKMPHDVGCRPADSPILAAMSLLQNTYRFEMQRYRAQSVDGDTAEDLSKFSQNFGRFLAAPVCDGRTPVENVELQRSRDDRTLAASATALRRIVEGLIRDNIPIEIYVRAQFVALDGAEQPPAINTLGSPEARKRYHTALREMPDMVRIALAVAIRTYAAEVNNRVYRTFPLTPEQAWASVLDNLQIALPALFRYCMALKIAAQRGLNDVRVFTEIAERFYDAAVLQYILVPYAYDSAWRDFLPPDFARNAEARYYLVFAGTTNNEEEVTHGEN